MLASVAASTEALERILAYSGLPRKANFLSARSPPSVSAPSMFTTVRSSEPNKSATLRKK